ncbi:MAG: polyprenyl synthetase family protein [Planctomycetes bacterium]|nr:polyprenyl synthetase family protein [Planctomycetota bacterium]
MNGQFAVAEQLQQFAKAFDRYFDRYLNPALQVPQELVDAIRYAALAPGKRIRPFLVAECCAGCGGMRDTARPVGAAVECIHAFSLIHDDLPAMDNDDLRRGQPTCHKKFGEAMAILAGDALVARAFELLTGEVSDPAMACDLVTELAQGTGWAGMIGGQAADLLGETKPPSLEKVRYIHQRKTASLFSAACRMGARVGGAAAAQVESLGRYGQALGQAFQIADDLLDVQSTSKALGKKTGKDATAQKQSFPACVGVEQSMSAAQSAVAEAVASIATFGDSAANLRELAEFVVSRNY